MKRFRKLAATVLAFAFVSALAASSASATFHEMSIREVYPAGDSSYVELEMWASGQNFVGGHHLVAYNSAGNPTDNFKFAANVPNGANQSTIVVADTDYPLSFDEMPAADETDPSLDLSPAGGAVCWVEGSPPDCVAWGNFNGASLPSPTGSPAAPSGVSAGMALRRSIAAGCPTLLERTDDTNDSASDFAQVSPEPRPNSVSPSAQPCSPPRGQEGGGANGGKSGAGAPQTILHRRPGKKIRDRTPTFRFASDEPGSTFQCKLDGKPFRPCRSPFTAKPLGLGSHRFKVRARDDSGKLDPSPASYGFKVIARR